MEPAAIPETVSAADAHVPCWKRRASVVRLLVVGVAVLCIGGTFKISDYFAAKSAVQAEVARAHVSAELLASNFRLEVEKFRLACVVLARDPDAQTALSERGTEKLNALDHKFEQLSREMHAAAIYLMSADGDTLAASNASLPSTFVGSNYSFRTYFQGAMREGQYEQFALGLSSHRPGLYVAKRVDYMGSPLGVVVIKLEFDALESDWKHSFDLAYATNQKGIILITSVQSWRFEMTKQLTPDEQARILQSLEFGDRRLTMNELFATGQVALAGSGRDLRRPYVEVVQALPSGWVVHILVPTRAAVGTAVTSARFLVLSLILLLSALVGFLVYRRKNAAFQSERVIAGRLRVLNERLVQANKLATIGQIAAGVGHEINQPLAAIASFAQNGLTFIKAGKWENAGENLTRIAALTVRIGAITSELRGFARKATGISAHVSIMDAINGALLLLGDRIRTLGATVIVSPKAFDATVVAEEVRLEQVFVNLLQNALDASGKGARIRISLAVRDHMIEVGIADNGSGVSEAARASMFQPFFSSKRDGLGLGLVISRDIMTDFGGELVVASPKQGALFIVRVRYAP
jgi:two-component system, NtrC family, C4-dicarboxylate transport sensor histidine kinase DctB